MTKLSLIIFGFLSPTTKNRHQQQISECRRTNFLKLQCGDFDPTNGTSVICWTQKFENCFRTNDTVSELIEILDKLGSLDLLEELTVYAINFSYFAIAAWAGSWISTTFQMWTAANQAEVIKVSILLVKIN